MESVVSLVSKHWKKGVGAVLGLAGYLATHLGHSDIGLVLATMAGSLLGHAFTPQEEIKDAETVIEDALDGDDK